VKVILCALLVAALCSCMPVAGPRGIKGDKGDNIVGPPGNDGHDGLNGHDGSNGNAGANGNDGSSCSVNQTETGAIISCTDGTGAVIMNGKDGEPSIYGIKELIDPCGHGPGFNEVLLRLNNGDILAHFSSGSLQFLSIIGPGNYMTTDAQACHFSINPDKSVVW
jgi:hypothetical protein